VSVSRPSQTGPHSEHFRQPPGYPRNIFSHFGARNVIINGLRHVANGHDVTNFETPHKFILLLIPPVNHSLFPSYSPTDSIVLVS
jgi:hypothetical protein